MIKGCQIRVQPDSGDYIVTVGQKKYRCHTLRGCFKAANGRWPEAGELDKFLDLVAYGE